LRPKNAENPKFVKKTAPEFITATHVAGPGKALIPEACTGVFKAVSAITACNTLLLPI
jgi:hypothetical protein